MTDEELISYRDDVREFMIAENEADTRIFQDVSKELISRLARGQKAIESIKKISKEYNSFLIFNPSSEYELLKSRRDFFWKLEKIITDFQQSCKEAADGN